ncbi:MAG: hypothetical protein CMH18_08195 [Methylophaga sp.]|uniref:hypothetical protein n=1 Tax=Methylophaga sp. TaxID=2024840 RepID=UPI000C8EA53F|nr:hypothetical protein [Methylophaga sp.]MAL49722.1 hypothetical protein [Methylophaga sp.]|tara:strand:+ start:6351 stop:6626 length:276 start_codon:yes stop_codon:yes gene_type:complete
MATEISENTKLQLNIKTIIAIIVLVSSFVGQYYVLSNEIELAKRLPESEISRSELDLKLELISKTVMSNAEKLNKMESTVEKIEERVYELK